MFKTILKQHPLLIFCCVLVPFFFAIIPVSIVHAATQHPAAQQAQTSLRAAPQEAAPTPTPIPTPTAMPTSTPTPTPQTGNVTLSSTIVQAGNQITVSGDNWSPAQQLTIQIAADGQSDVLVFGATSTDAAGHFSTSLTIPATATPGPYTLIVFYTNATGMFVRQANVLTVNAPAPTPTPTPTPSPSPSPTPSPTPSATATTTTTTTGNSNSGGGSGLSVLIFTLGGLGILLIVVGVIMFAVSSPPAPAR